MNDLGMAGDLKLGFDARLSARGEGLSGAQDRYEQRDGTDNRDNRRDGHKGFSKQNYDWGHLGHLQVIDDLLQNER